MKGIHSDISIVPAIGAAVLGADNTPAAIDLQGYNAAEIMLAIGIGGITFTATNKIEFVVTHSDDNATYVPVEDKDILGVSGIADGIIKALKTAHADADCSRFGYVGGKRYLKVLAKFSGTHGTGTPIAVMVIKGYGHDNPQADQA